MSPYGSYKLRHRFEFLQVMLAWCLCYLWIVPYLLLLAILVIVLVTLAGLAAKAGDSDIGLLILGLGLVGLVGTHIPAIHLFIRIIKAHRAAKDISKLEALPPRHAEIVKSRLNTIINKMPERDRKRFRVTPLRLLVERRNHKATPCMIVRHGTLNLILSLGFFKVLSGDPEAADAMLAHEMAHFLQRDSSFLLSVRSYLKASRVMFFYMLVSFAMGLIFALISWSNLADQRKHLLSDKNQSDSIYYFSNYGPIRARTSGPSLGQIETRQLSLVFQVVAQFLSFPYYFLLLFYLRRRVQRSEMLADLFAAITTTPAAVDRFLQGYIADTDERLSLHPPVGRRMKYLSKFAS